MSRDDVAEMREWVLAIERAYVAIATGGAMPADGGAPDGVASSFVDELARASLGAVASHYLAVGTPRTLGVVGAFGAARASLMAHRAWFAPREVRCHGGDAVLGAECALRAVAGTAELRDVTLAEVLACDIVCVHAPIVVAAAQLRRGTHVNVLHPGAGIDDELAALAVVSREVPDLGRLAAGLVDGRQLDELTVFVAGDARLAGIVASAGMRSEVPGTRDR